MHARRRRKKAATRPSYACSRKLERRTQEDVMKFHLPAPRHLVAAAALVVMAGAFCRGAGVPGSARAKGSDCDAPDTIACIPAAPGPDQGSGGSFTAPAPAAAGAPAAAAAAAPAPYPPTLCPAPVPV